MSSKIDLRLQVLQTEIQVVYSNIARLEADVVVSSDDVLLSMGGGVARAIRAAASSETHNAALDDIRKHALPIPIGEVLVTSAGQLPAKYIFNVVAIDFHSQPRPRPLLAQIVRRVMELAASLRVQSIGVPLLGTGLIGLPDDEALDFIIRSVACFLVSEPCKLQRITIALYKDKLGDQAAAEQGLYEALAPLREQIARWARFVAPYNRRMSLLRSLRETLAEEPELAQALAEEAEPFTQLRYDKRRQRLSQRRDELAAEADLVAEALVKLQRNQRTYERRLQASSGAEASKWQDKLSRAAQDAQKYEKQRADNMEQQLVVRREEEALTHTWESYQVVGPAPDAPGAGAPPPDPPGEDGPQLAMTVVDTPAPDKLDELRRVIEAQLAADRQTLGRVFGCPQARRAGTVPLTADDQTQASRSQEERERLEQRLRSKLEDLDNEMAGNERIIDASTRRRQESEVKRATLGVQADYSLTTDIEEAQKIIDQHKALQQHLEEERRKTLQALDGLQQG